MKSLRLLLAALLLAFAAITTAADRPVVNINTADLAALQALNGVGAKLAAEIVAYRDKNGPFATVDDLEKVKGIGKKLVEKNRELLTVE